MSNVTYTSMILYDDVTSAKNSSSDQTAREFRRLVEFVCYAGLTTLVCLIGIPTNIINCVVFQRQGLSDRVNLCLFSLALSDCLYLLCAFTASSVNSLLRFYDESLGEEWFLKFGVSLLGFLNGLRITSSCIGAMIAVDRCICVVWPLRANTIIKTRTTFLFILISFLLSQVCQVLPFTFDVVGVNTDGAVHWVPARSQLYYDHKMLIDMLVVTILGAITPITGFCIVFIATTATVIKLKLAMKWRSKSDYVSSGINDRQMTLTTIIVISSSIYVVTMFPFVLREISFWIIDDCLLSVTCNDIFMAFTAIVYTCAEINGSIHFFIYYSRSSRYRAVLKGIFSNKKTQTLVDGEI